MAEMSKKSKFCFSVFENEIVNILRDCNYINLPIEIPGVIVEVNHLLTNCGRVFFQDNLNSNDLQECESLAKVVLDIVWEKMNTGHWKDVDPNWRYAYTYASLFRVLCLLAKKDNKIEIIEACDMGLLMGAPLMKNILSKIASKLSLILMDERNKNLEPKAKYMKISPDSQDIDLSYPVQIERDLSQIDFSCNYLKKLCPVVLEGAIKNWPASSTKMWTVDYFLDRFCLRTVPIEIGSKYTDDSWTQKLMTIGEFVEKYIQNKCNQKEVGYLAQHNLFDQIPELFEDFEIPSYITNKDNVDISIWFGPGGTISPLHFDPKCNLLAQVMGEKYVRLYSEEETQYLYPRNNTWLSNTSQVDAENPDLNLFPLFSKANYKECVLKPGDLLFIPPRCWHYVRSLSTSISISFWW